VALLAPDVVAAVGEVAVVEAVAEKIQDVIAVSPVAGMRVVLRLFAVLPHITVELAVGEDAVAAEGAHNWDIEARALAEEHLAADLALGDLACAAEDRVGAVGAVDHYEDCK
jgi:hypothetical protein